MDDINPGSSGSQLGGQRSSCRAPDLPRLPVGLVLRAESATAKWNFPAANTTGFTSLDCSVLGLEDGRNSHEEAIRDKHKGGDYRGGSLHRHRRRTHFLPLLALSGGAWQIFGAACAGFTRRGRRQPSWQRSFACRISRATPPSLRALSERWRWCRQPLRNLSRCKQACATAACEARMSEEGKRSAAFCLFWF